MRNEDLQKHTLHLRRGDWDYLESIFKPNGITTSAAVRTLVSQFVDRKRREEEDRQGRLPDVNINVDL